MPQAYINYYKKSLEELKELPVSDKKPRLLLHACCGPCACWPLLFLCPHFNVTIYFNNSNIFPEEEYDRRLGELEKLLGYIKKDYGYDVSLIVTNYDNETYNKDLEPFKDAPEGGRRCQICYKKRMSQAYDYAENNDYDYFTTVMSISRQKDSEVLNAIGAILEKSHHKTKYFYSDFKKAKGIDKGREMRIHYDLYNQLYCGCKYTYAKGIEKEKERETLDENKGTIG
jgi:predicted adenine nucleotide alpha hydrolase (AANH) superfamily ATPase